MCRALKLWLGPSSARVSSLQNRSGFSVLGGGVPTHVPPAALDVCPRKGMALSFHRPRVFFHSVFLIFLFFSLLAAPLIAFTNRCGESFPEVSRVWQLYGVVLGLLAWNCETFGDAFIGTL